MSIKVVAEIPDHVLSTIDEFGEDVGRRKLAEICGISEMSARYYLRLLKEQNESYTHEFKLIRRQLQKQRDKLRIVNAGNRIEDRYYNALSEYTKELIEAVNNIEKPYTINHESVSGRTSGILQISDAHFNELINIYCNTYDFDVGSKRLKKFVSEAIPLFRLYDVEEVLVAMTGDMINSDRRLDELLSCATNRARATFLSEILLEQAIVELNNYFNVKVVHVSGNESRAGDVIGWVDLMISDNYDTMIYELLKLRLSDCAGVDFIDGDIDEIIVKLNGKNILITHGHGIAKGVSEGGVGSKIQQMKGKYGDVGVTIDYVIFGHLHDTRISDSYARSGSICGANAYSDRGLQLSTRASQLIHIVKGDGINTFKIDLQEVDGYKGYEIEEALKTYNAKSVGKVECKRVKKI